MKSILWSLIGGIVVYASLCAPVSAEVKVEAQELGPAGQWTGIAISPRGVYVAVLAMKGSRYVVLIDGVEGPKIDQLLMLEGYPYNPPDNLNSQTFGPPRSSSLTMARIARISQRWAMNTSSYSTERSCRAAS